MGTDGTVSVDTESIGLVIVRLVAAGGGEAALVANGDSDIVTSGTDREGGADEVMVRLSVIVGVSLLLFC